MPRLEQIWIKRALLIGAGLAIIGGAAGIGRIGGSAVESMARQPGAAGQISTAMIITAETQSALRILRPDRE